MRDPAFFEGLFPEAGPWSALKEANGRNSGPKAESVDRAGNGNLVPSKSCFTAARVKHFNTMFRLLGDNQEAKGALASVLEFAQLKDDVAGF